MSEFIFVVDCSNGKNVSANVKEGSWDIWSAERIERAFNFGNGTEKDFSRFIKDNKLKAIPEYDFVKKYPESYNNNTSYINSCKKFCLNRK